jgi:hypothetical protein
MKGKAGCDSTPAVILDFYFLVAHSVPQEYPSRYVKRSKQQMVQIPAAQIRIGERNRQLVIVVAHRRAEKKWRNTLDIQRQRRYEPCPVMVNAFFPRRRGSDVAIVIEYRKSIAVLEDTNAFIGQAGIGEDSVGVAIRRPPEQTWLLKIR